MTQCQSRAFGCWVTRMGRSKRPSGSGMTTVQRSWTRIGDPKRRGRARGRKRRERTYLVRPRRMGLPSTPMGMGGGIKRRRGGDLSAGAKVTNERRRGTDGRGDDWPEVWTGAAGGRRRRQLSCSGREGSRPETWRRMGDCWKIGTASSGKQRLQETLTPSVWLWQEAASSGSHALCLCSCR